MRRERQRPERGPHWSAGSHRAREARLEPVKKVLTDRLTSSVIFMVPPVDKG